MCSYSLFFQKCSLENNVNLEEIKLYKLQKKATILRQLRDFEN